MIEDVEDLEAGLKVEPLNEVEVPGYVTVDIVHAHGAALR